LHARDFNYNLQPKLALVFLQTKTDSSKQSSNNLKKKPDKKKDQPEKPSTSPDGAIKPDSSVSEPEDVKETPC
jgi:hypothetical protein